MLRASVCAFLLLALLAPAASAEALPAEDKVEERLQSVLAGAVKTYQDRLSALASSADAYVIAAYACRGALGDGIYQAARAAAEDAAAQVTGDRPQAARAVRDLEAALREAERTVVERMGKSLDKQACLDIIADRQRSLLVAQARLDAFRAAVGKTGVDLAWSVTAGVSDTYKERMKALSDAALGYVYAADMCRGALGDGPYNTARAVAISVWTQVLDRDRATKLLTDGEAMLRGVSKVETASMHRAWCLDKISQAQRALSVEQVQFDGLLATLAGK